MVKKKAAESAPPNKIRRKDRAKDDQWIRNFLRYGAVGTMATSKDSQPFLVTRNYVYDESQHAIYIHGAKKGRTIDNIQYNENVCFTVAKMGRLLPASDVIEVSVEYAGVVVFGKATIVSESDEALYGLELLLTKYFPHIKSGLDDKPISPDSLNNTAVIKIDIDYWSGKENKVRDDFPGAFFYDENQVNLDLYKR